MKNFSITKNILSLSNQTYWDFDKRILVYEGEKVLLSSSQTKVFELLALKANKQVDGMDLFSFIWDDYERNFNAKYIRNLISSIRKKAPNIHIKNVYGGLYVLVTNNEDKHLTQFINYAFEALELNPSSTAIIEKINDTYTIIYVNNAYRKMFKLPSDENVYGASMFSVFADELSNQHVNIVKKSLDLAKSIEIIIQLKAFDGTPLYSKLMINPIFDRKSNELKYFVAVFKDYSVIANAYFSLSNMMTLALPK